MVRKGYVQLVNSFYMNRKVRKLRHTCPSAIGAFTMMLTFCGDNLSDGHISEDDAFYVLDITDSEIDALCEVGMIEPDGNNGTTFTTISHTIEAANRCRRSAKAMLKNTEKIKTRRKPPIQITFRRLNRV